MLGIEHASRHYFTQTARRLQKTIRPSQVAGGGKGGLTAYPAQKTLDLSPYSDTWPHQKTHRRLHQPSERRLLVRDKQFPPYLTRRLNWLAKSLDDSSKYAIFLRNLSAAVGRTSQERSTDKGPVKEDISKPERRDRITALVETLQSAFLETGPEGVDKELSYAYNSALARRENVHIGEETQQTLLDFRYPSEWHRKAREIRRVIHLHIGPTNSGKTYHALQALEKAKRSIYAGPLRLLAHEVYSRLKAQGKRCELVTGDEQILAEEGEANITSCTVEMVPLSKRVDVAVIDEIQMLADTTRGWAWTQAFLGVMADEVHLCGEERSLPLIRQLTAYMGDELKVHTYKRLTPLKVMDQSLGGDWKSLQKGDCVITFSKVRLHAMKAQIELATQKRVALVYGSLPPDIRSQQASLFNDPDNDYDFLVATDAIGMGLNLGIKRIIFESVAKKCDNVVEILPPHQLKQIAGRAGRFRTARQAIQDAGQSTDRSDESPDGSKAESSTGWVTTLDKQDLPILRRAIEADPPPILSAGILPPPQTLIQFARRFPPSISFSYIWQRMHRLALMHPRYHLCDPRNPYFIADIIHSVESLSHEERLVFCRSPMGHRDFRLMDYMRSLARAVGDRTSGQLLDLSELPLSVLDEPVMANKSYLQRLEDLHKALILYLWLGYRFPDCFVDQAMAFYVKDITEKRIDQILIEFSDSPVITSRIALQKAEARKIMEQEHLNPRAAIKDIPNHEPGRQNPEGSGNENVGGLASDMSLVSIGEVEASVVAEGHL